MRRRPRDRRKAEEGGAAECHEAVNACVWSRLSPTSCGPGLPSVQHHSMEDVTAHLSEILTVGTMSKKRNWVWFRTSDMKRGKATSLLILEGGKVLVLKGPFFAGARTTALPRPSRLCAHHQL